MQSLSQLDRTGNPLQHNFSLEEKISFLHSQLDAGRHIFPLNKLLFDENGRPFCPCYKFPGCSQIGKHPKINWGSPWSPENPRTYKLVEKYVSLFPSRGFGLHVGSSGLAVLDVDSRHGGIESLKSLCQLYGVDVPGYTVNSSGSGGHVYFSAPIHAQSVRGFIGPNGESRASIPLSDGVEIFFGQHFVALPFSPHKTGCWYTLGPNQVVLPLPQWLLNMVLAKDVFKIAEKPSVAYSFALPRLGPAAGDSVLERARAYAMAIPEAVSGERGSSKTAYVARQLVVGFGLTIQQAMPIMLEWNDTCVPPWTVEELHRKLTWADALPGARGELTERNNRGFSRHEAEFKSLEGVTVKVMGDRCLLNVTDGTTTTVPREEPASPVDYNDIEIKSDVLSSSPGTTSYDAKEEHDSPACVCCFHLLMRHIADPLLRMMRLPRRNWDCPRCGPARRRHHADTVHVRITEWAESLPVGTEPILYFSKISRDQREYATRYIRRRKGDFFRIVSLPVGQHPADSFLLVSTLPIAGIPHVCHDAQSSIAEIQQIIGAWPWSIKIRVWWSSRRWKLIPDVEKKDRQWRKVCKVKHSIADQRAILERYEIQLKIIRGTGKYTHWWAEQGEFKVGQWEDIKEDLECGFYTGGMKLTLAFGAPEISEKWRNTVIVDSSA